MEDIKPYGTTIIYFLKGEIDHHTSHNIRSYIELYTKENNVKNIIFDFSNVTFMDSAGIGMLIGRYKALSYVGGKVYICGLAPNINKIITLSGLNKIMEISDTAEKALEMAKGGQTA